MSSVTVVKAKVATKNGNGQRRPLLTPLNLHWAGVGLLALVSLYFIVRMGLLWHASSSYNADAIAEQRAELQRAEVAVQPLRGLDAKLASATGDADKFYRERLPVTDSEVAAELGSLTKKAGVRLAGAGYGHAPMLAGSSGELTELRIDARMSGDYRPLVRFLNSLERDRMFFVIDAVTLTGQQTGTVNLRLKLTTYMRTRGGADEASPTAIETASAGGLQ